jgi:uncharacterized membrane protein YoaK (UPF0700 family)
MSDTRTPPTGHGGSYLRDPAHGPLPALLVVLTAVTGVIDAVSILDLGRVFVANMTGNVVFLGFALARAPGFSLAASAAALAGFLLGGVTGGRLIALRGSHRGLLLRDGALSQFALVGVALAVSAPIAHIPDLGARIAISALCAVAMGIQNSVARNLAVPDLTTTVLTMTLTGIAADRTAGYRGRTVRRMVAVLTTLAGAFVGAEVVLHTRLVWGLAAVAGLLAVVVVGSALASRSPAPWQVPSHA